MEHWAGVEILRMAVQKCANNSYLHFCTTISWSQYNLRQRLDPGLMLVTRDATAQCCQCVGVMSYTGLVQMCNTPPKRELLCIKLMQTLWGMWKLARPLHWELPSTWLALFMSHDCHDIWHTTLFHITWLSWYTTYPAIYVTCLLWYTFEAVFMLRSDTQNNLSEDIL